MGLPPYTFLLSPTWGPFRFSFRVPFQSEEDREVSGGRRQGLQDVRVEPRLDGERCGEGGSAGGPP